MKADAAPLLALFEKKARLEVPLFQRQYVWSGEHQWEPLWEDICRKFSERLEGRLDAPVYFPRGDGARSKADSKHSNQWKWLPLAPRHVPASRGSRTPAQANAGMSDGHLYRETTASHRRPAP